MDGLDRSRAAINQPRLDPAAVTFFARRSAGGMALRRCQASSVGRSTTACPQGGQPSTAPTAPDNLDSGLGPICR
jgi:hypothetical protein